MSRSPWIISVLPKRLKPVGARLVGTHRAVVKRVRRLVSKWLPEPKTVAHVPIQDFLQDAHIKLLELLRRQHLLEAVDAEWSRITRGKDCAIHDEATFRAVLDVDSMNVIDLCSWGIGASDSDESLLLRVKNHYLPELPPIPRWAERKESASLARLMDDRFVEARERLFPKAAGRYLTGKDAEELIQSFETRIQPLRDDRNKNRAHAHEHRTHGTAKPLDLAEVREMYGQARQVLNDLCLVGFGSTWAETDLTSNNVKMTAEDLLDVVFLPNWFRRETRSIARNDVYDALHTDPSGGSFNDKTKLKALADRLTSAGGDAPPVIDAPPG